MELLAADWSARPTKHARMINSCREDLLSKLPDELLLLVLRCLSAVEAVRTGSLAQRWRHLPSLLPVRPHLLLGSLFFPLYPDLPPYLSLDLDAIDSTLSFETSHLRSCEIVPDAAPDAPRIQRWAEALARRGIRELVFDLRRQPPRDASPFIIFCRSLLKLDVRSGILYSQSFCLCFPTPITVGCVSLTHLRLKEVEISDRVLLVVAATCKALTHLEVIDCKHLYSFCVKKISSLKDLTFHSRNDAYICNLRSIDIDAPNLEVLNLRTQPPTDGFKVVAPKLRSAYLYLLRTRRHLFPAAAEGVRRLIQGATDVACLQLRGGAVEVSRRPVAFLLHHHHLVAC